MVTHTPWEIESADANPILGDAHVPESPVGVVLVIHGFLGYKDYGMFPWLARAFAAAGFITHRFNLSRSGMTNSIETFERPELFEKDTWNAQVHDVSLVIESIQGGALVGARYPLFLFGHSRGGVTALLTAGRKARGVRTLAGVVTAAAPSFCCSWTDEQKREHMERGYSEVVSNRTKQTLRIGRAWLAEQLEDPAAHDVLAHARDTECPVLVVHGADDPTVPASCADEIARAAGQGPPVVIDGADHVFRTPNPMPEGAAPSPQLSRLAGLAAGFFRGLAATD